MIHVTARQRARDTLLPRRGRNGAPVCDHRAVQPQQDDVVAPVPARAGSTPSQLRRHNMGVVLELLHRDGPASRSELGTATGLTRSTIADLVQDLVACGVAVESGSARPTGPGRPSAVVRARPEGAVALAVEVAVESIAVATVGLGGEVLATERVESAVDALAPAEVVDRVAAMAGPLLAQHAEGPVGVGVAVPGLVRRRDGFVHVAPNLGWQEVALASMLGRALGPGDRPLPVQVANEADLGALGELRRGAGRGVGTMVYVSGDVGIGAGLVIDGRAMLGATGYAGEAGHMLVDPGGRDCRCGARGCWETVAGEEALLRAAGIDDAPGARALALLRDRLRSGDPQAEHAVGVVGHWVGVGLGNLVNLLNPEVVVLGGHLQQLHEHLRPSLETALAARALAQPRSAAHVVPGTQGRQAQLHGAAELVLAGVLRDPVARA